MSSFIEAEIEIPAEHERNIFGQFDEHVDAENGNQLYVKNIILEYENWDYYMSRPSDAR